MPGGSRACRLIETSDELPSLDELAQAAGLSRFHFHRVFKSATGLTPKAYAVACRAERARQALAHRATVPRRSMRQASIPAGASMPVPIACSA
ncbi:hypothetical protein BWR19_12655 [Halomonas sp. 1513]|nr:hypothetical protein BWR19_12655 [Halomonas sp. 1513]